MKGKSTQPVGVRPKVVSVRLGSYPGDGEGDRPIRPPLPLDTGDDSTPPIAADFDADGQIDLDIGWQRTSTLAIFRSVPGGLQSPPMFKPGRAKVKPIRTYERFELTHGIAPTDARQRVSA